MLSKVLRQGKLAEGEMGRSELLSQPSANLELVQNLK